MRLYTFSHYMLSSIQQTIQGGHAIARLFVKYADNPTGELNSTLMDWATNHETWIALNGGNSDSLRDIRKRISNPDLKLPYATFREDVQSLDGILTSIALILPTRICDAIDTQRGFTDVEVMGFSELNAAERDLVIFMSKLPLAR